MVIPAEPDGPNTTVEPVVGITPSDQFSGSDQFTLLLPIQVFVAANPPAAEKSPAATERARLRFNNPDLAREDKGADLADGGKVFIMGTELGGFQ
jgi:hypothetical protein